ncbi:MAG TPA: hypothetical protein VLV18_06375 [Terriglobales bacterium]|nr:hypothetical protein [Terriglobales bacterium]
MNTVSVSALVFGNATRVFQNQIFDVWGLTSSPLSRVGHLYTGSGCVSGNLVQTQAAVVNIPPVYIVQFGGESPGPHSVEVDGDPDGCVNFDVLAYPSSTVTVTNTVTVTQATTVTVTISSIVEYPYGLPILAVLMILFYAITKRRTKSPRRKPCPVS